MIKIYSTTAFPFYELKSANFATIGKKIKFQTTQNVNFEDQKKYFKKCFLAEHSTIEILQFCVVDDQCRADIANQIVRATKGHPRFMVQSRRPDWNNGEPRKPSDQTYGIFRSYWNPLSFMQMSRQRLCTNAQEITRTWVQDLIHLMTVSNDPMLEALAECCVPQCQYRGNRCYEIKPCGLCPAEG